MDWSLLLQAISSLLVVVGLIGACALLARRFNGLRAGLSRISGNGAAPDSTHLRIVEQISTSPRNRIAVVAVANRRVLVSITPNGSTFLCDVPATHAQNERPQNTTDAQATPTPATPTNSDAEKRSQV